MVKTRYVLTSSYTKDGLKSFIPDLISGLRQIFILKGAAGTGKATFIRMIGDFMNQKGYDVEYWISAADALNPEGVMIPQLETAIVNGSIPAAIDPKYPGVTGHLVYLGDYLDSSLAKDQAERIVAHLDGWEKQSRQAVAWLNTAARIKSEIKQGAVTHLNIHKMYDLINQLYAQVTVPESDERHFFASAMTAAGYITYVEELSAGCRKRLILKGPIGCGKSTVIGAVAEKARAHGHRVEYYHCGLEAESLIMVILPNFNVAVIDGGRVPITARRWDTVIDMESYLDAFDEDEFCQQFSEKKRQYEDLLCQAQSELEIGQQHMKAVKRIYSSAMDFARWQSKMAEIQRNLLEDSQDDA